MAFNSFQILSTVHKLFHLRHSRSGDAESQGPGIFQRASLYEATCIKPIRNGTLSFQKSIPKSRFQNPFIKLLQPVRPIVLRPQYVKRVVRYDANGGNFNIEYDRTAPYQASCDLFFPYLFGLFFFFGM